MTNMKCPFRTKRKVRYVRYVTQENTRDYDEVTEFAECLEDECPFYGVTRFKYRATGELEPITDPKCRRANNG